MSPVITEPAVSTPDTEAHCAAGRNWRANVRALAPAQGRAVEVAGAPADDLIWVFARDGYLTCFEPGEPAERWHAGCSVPLLAARAMLKPLDSAAGVACFLAPVHASQLRVALDRLLPSHALICVVPDARALRVMLHCDDFSADVAHGRLWFAAGESWPQALAATLTENPGLPAPTRFIRMPNAEATLVERFVADAQRVLSEQNARRTAAVASIRSGWAPRRPGGSPPRVCIIARSTFRLWDDAGNALYECLTASSAGGGADAEWRRLDPDDPARSSPLAVATATAAADAVVAADLSRADAPRLVPDRLPWVTWVTTPRVPSFQAAGPHDRLLVADPAWRDNAVRAGWPADRVDLAGWPTPLPPLPKPGDGAGLVLVADTLALDAPESLSEFSSHALLWEQIRREVSRDPFAVPGNVLEYVRAHARAQGVATESLNLPLFAERLVIPAYQQGIAAAMIDAGVAVRLYGAGWGDLPRFRAHAAGPVTTREQLRKVAAGAAALIHAWPDASAHPIDSLGRPVGRRTGVRRETYLRDLRLALGPNPGMSHVPPAPRLSAQGVLAAVTSMR